MKENLSKSLLYEQVARIGKAIASSKRLELLELLAQGEKTVEMLAVELSSDIRLTSAHLKVLKEARLVTSRRDGRYQVYGLSGSDIASLLVYLRQVAETHLIELKIALQSMVDDPGTLSGFDRGTLLDQARRGEIIMIDVRPQTEYDTAHLPFARSMPLQEIERRMRELPAGKDIVAYCRGPYCLLSDAAVSLLRAHGYQVSKITDGVSEWQAAGLPVEQANSTEGGL